MATLSNSQRLREARKKREEENKSSSSQSASRSYLNSEKLEKRSLERSIGMDTFESDVTNLGTTISNIYSGWQTQETMRNTRSSVEAMQRRINDYQTYQQKYGGADLSDLASGYQSVLDDWDNLTSVYGNYQNADAFNTAKKKAQMDSAFGGLSYDEVQAKKNEYEEDSDEYKYLSEYTGYTDLRDFDKALEGLSDGDYKKQLQTARNQHALDNTFDLYKDYMDAEDFDEKSQYKKVKYDGLWDRLSNAGKDVYEYVNYIYSMPEDARTAINSDEIGAAGFGKVPSGIGEMTDDEFKTFFYIANEQGYDKGLEYIKDMEVALSKRGTDKDNKRQSEWLESGNAVDRKLKQGVMSALSVPAGLVGKFEGALDDATNILTGDEINPYNSSHAMANSASNIQRTTSENIDEYTVKNDWVGTNIPIIGNVWSSAYNDALSIGENALGAATFGPAYAYMAASGAFTSKAKELKEAGVSDEQIRNGAISSAVFEYLGEKIGVDKLFKIKNVDSVGKLLKNMGGQMIAEGSEEMVTEFLNIAGDAINRGALSDASVKYQDYIDRGFSKEEAWKNTIADFGSQIAKAGISGAISGAVMGGGYGTIQYHNNAKTGQAVRDNYAVDDLKDIASELNNEAYADYLKLIEGGKISNAKLGNLYTEVSDEVSENLEHEKANVQMRPIANMATELGETKNAGMIASAITKHLNGEKLSAEEKATLKTDTAKTILEDVKRDGINVKATDSFNKAYDNMSKVKNIVDKLIDEVERRKRVEELSKGEVTEVTATGNSAKIEGIRIEDGSTTVLTSEGEVKAEDMTFSSNDAEILSYAEIMGAEKGNLFISQYDGKQDVSDYHKSFNLAYAYGETGFGADSVLQNKGVLTETQASEIYKSAVKYKANARQTAIDEINAKYAKNVIVPGTFDDSVIDYNNKTADGSKVNWKTLTSTQRRSVTFAKAFSQATGVNIRFVKSEVVNGKHTGKNGSYDPNTNTIEIDVYAGRMDAKALNDSIIPTLSHELTHWMKAKSPALYSKMSEYVSETLAMDGRKTSDQRIIGEMNRMASAHADMEATAEGAVDEIVARACEDMLSNSKKAREFLDGLSESERKSFIDKVKETYHNLIDWINHLLGEYESESEEAQILRKYEDRLKELSKMWDQALEDAVKTNQALRKEGITGEKAIGENLFTENTAQLSIRTYENEGKALLHDWLDKSDLDDETKTEIMEQMDHVYDVATKYAANSDLIDFSSWSESDVIRRDNGTPILTVVVPNGEYPLNIDFSQICKKRKALNSVLNALVRSGDLDMRTLSQSDIGNINRIIKEHGFEIACALCFVDSKRYRVNEWADSFADTYNKLVESLTKGTEYKVDEFNYTGRKLTQPKGKLLKNADDSELNFDYINEVLAKNSSGKAIYRYALAIKNNKDLRSKLNSSEIISSAGLDAIKVQNETLYALVNSHQGSAKPKLSHSENPYGYEILLDERFNAEDAYKVGGVRIQSFSDYMANMFFDYVQMIGDLSAKQLPAHAYTKEYYFAKLFGLTGIKINLSIVPKGADITDEQKARFNKMTKAAKEKDAEFKALKAHAGLDAEGNYILEDETFPLDKALELQNTEGYDKNCGIIWVGVSDKHIEKMLDDDNVPFIIPYHKSSLNPAIARMRNIDFYNDYTKAQNTRYDSKAKKKVPSSVWSFDFYADLAKTNDPKQTAENYKTECKNRGYLPKFDDFKDHPNYYKLLVDFRVYDKAGNYAPQGAVKMAFPNDFNKIVGESLTEAQDTQKRLDADMHELLDEIRRELKLGQEQYSDRVYEYDQAEDNDLAEFVGSVADGNAREKDYRVISNHISDRLAVEIQKIVGLNVRGYGNEIDKGQVEHILKEHGEHGRSDNSMADVGDIARIGYAIENFDKIREGNNRSKYKNADGTKAKTVELQTRIGNNFYYVVEAVPDAKVKKLKVVSAYINKKDTFSEVAVPNGPSRYVQDESQSYVFNNIIPDSAKNTTTSEKFSDRDSDGNRLTKAQIEFFKDSKVRDEDGNLRVVYHGSEADFTVFDRTKARANMDIQGSFFSPWDIDAGGYGGNVRSFYLNIKNPASESMGYKALNKFKGQNGAGIKAREYLESLGYDGVNNGDEEYIAFYPEQIKLITNTNPTDSDDVRYSDRTMTRSEANQLARQRVASYKEQMEKKAKIESITQKALVLNRWMLKNSKDEHVPEAMKPLVAHLLKAIDFSSKQLLGMRCGQRKGQPTRTDISLSQALADIQQIMSKGEVDGEVLYELYGADLDADMADLVKSVNLYMRTVGDNEYVLNQMTLDELHKFDKIVGAIKASVTKMNQFHVANTRKSIAYTAQQDILSMNELGQAKLHKSQFMKGVSQMINWGNINPYFAFKRFGEGGKKIFEALQDGWDKFAFNVKKIIDYAEETYSSEDVKAWSEEVHEFDVLLPATKAELADPKFKGNHQRIQMTTAQIMSLYCLQKREQAKGHISGGGIRITDIETKNGIVSQSEGVALTEKELNKIIGTLTAEQKTVSDKLQKFMNEDCATWGNEISMARFGYKAFGEPNYFPIRSDENITNDGEVKEKEKSLYRLLNMSFTKALTDKANNRIVVDNIFDVFSQHTSEMAKYNALALPVLDAVRWFNYKEKGQKVDTHFKTYSVKQAMEKAFGKDAKHYVNTFLEDINGADNVGRDSLAKGFFANAKIAAVGFNIKTAALQPTSYLRASAIIDPKYLVKASDPTKVKRGIEMAEKWCGMALWKSLGFYDTNIQRGVAELIKHDKTWKDKVTEASMKGAEKMDKITWGCLWNACEEEVKATRKDLAVGTDEYYTTVGKRLREVIYATQVVDSTMTRSHMMRSPDKWDKVLTNFASEPTLAYNMLMDVFYDWKMTERKTNKSEAFKQHKDKMARVALAYTATNLVTSLLETAFQAYRDDDDEEEDLKEYVISFLESFGSNMGISTKIPYVKDLISILQGFTSSRTDTQWMQNLTYAFKDWMKIFSGKGNVYKAVHRTMSTASQLSGIALGNAMRDLASFWNLTIGNIFPSLKLYK